MWSFCSSTMYFFFWQKTSYEMRISVWSSDVCSSDLCAAYLPRSIVDRQPPVEEAPVEAKRREARIGQVITRGAERPAHRHMIGIDVEHVIRADRDLEPVDQRDAALDVGDPLRAQRVLGGAVAGADRPVVRAARAQPLAVPVGARREPHRVNRQDT